jgi:hypothetical protein
MKYLLSFLLFLSMANCRDKNVAPEILQPLVAKWRLVAYERVENGKKVREEIEWSGDEFILNLCGWAKSKYVRVP